MEEKRMCARVQVFAKSLFRQHSCIVWWTQGASTVIRTPRCQHVWTKAWMRFEHPAAEYSKLLHVTLWGTRRSY